MYYNKWTLKQHIDRKKRLTFSIVLDEGDMQDRVESHNVVPTGGPGFAVIHFPRKDAEQNEKYKKVLISYAEESLLEQLDSLKKTLEALRKIS